MTLPISAHLETAVESDAGHLASSDRLLVALTGSADSAVGDRHFNAPNVREACEHTGRILVTTRYGAYPHTDSGVEVRRIFHKLPSYAFSAENG